MAQQVGSTSGTASTARETKVTPGGESGVTEAGWPGGTGQASQPAGGEAGLADGATAGQASEGSAASQENASQDRAGRVRGWLRRTPPAAVATVATAPSMVAAGPDLDLAANDPLVGYLLSAATAVDITGLQLQSPALRPCRRPAWCWWSR